MNPICLGVKHCAALPKYPSLACAWLASAVLSCRQCWHLVRLNSSCTVAAQPLQSASEAAPIEFSSFNFNMSQCLWCLGIFQFRHWAAHVCLTPLSGLWQNCCCSEWCVLRSLMFWEAWSLAACSDFLLWVVGLQWSRTYFHIMLDRQLSL